jgi:alginate O-acetyltransferase complex protein AlgJ
MRDEAEPMPGADGTSATPMQSALRVHAVALFAILLGSVPLLHLWRHVVRGKSTPWVPVRSQTDWPAATPAAVLDGQWMPAVERHLREASPVVWWLRGNWNELLLRLDQPVGDRVHVGRDGWLFLRSDANPSAELLAAGAAARKWRFASVRDRLRALGCELVVSIVPDKSGIYPELRRDGGPASPKQALYAHLLDEVRSLAIPVIDVKSAMAAIRAVEPDRELYFRGDSHWQPYGALAAGQAAALLIEAGPLAARLSPRVPVQLGARTTFHALGDLVAMLGICTADLPWDDGRRVTVGLSLQAHAFRELRSYYAVAPEDPALAERFDGNWPAAEVVLVGTSFAKENGLPALMLALGRPVRMVQENGATGIVPMTRLLEQLEQPGALLPKLVVWEVVERGLFEPSWEQR